MELDLTQKIQNFDEAHDATKSIVERFLSVPIETLVRETYRLNEKSLFEDIYNVDGQLKVASLLEYAETLLKAHDFSNAKNIFKTISKNDDYKAKAYVGLAEIYLAQQDILEAEKSVRESLMIEWDFKAIKILSEILISTSRANDAIKVLSAHMSSSLFKAEEEFEIRLLLGNANALANSISEAKTQYALAYKLQADSYDLQIAVARLAAKTNNFKAACFHYEEARKAMPFNETIYLEHAESLMIIKNYRKAYSVLLQLLNHNINNEDALLMFAKAAIEIKEFEITNDFFEEFIDNHSDNFTVILAHAEFLLDSQKLEESKHVLKKLLIARPGFQGVDRILRKLSEVFDHGRTKTQELHAN